ncbi:MAG: hypothetical protein KatS3mg115_0933 [Candidatus Poribacteria bacterium]|nr:MAG: hypothetical protein KatS3mg115_0933 [Candidatus Poribacteria bacterium]
MERGRGALILVLGILGIVSCGFLGIPAWIMGHRDLQKMERGEMDPSDRGLTRAGMILGIIATLVLVIGAIAGFLMGGLAALCGLFGSFVAV